MSQGKPSHPCLAFLLPAALLFLSSCIQKELCTNHWEHMARYDVNINAGWELDWEYTYGDREPWETKWNAVDYEAEYDDLRPTKPEGLRAVLYPSANDTEARNISNDGGVLPMREDNYSILFYNNDTEFIVFNEMDLASGASATTRSKSRSTYSGSPFIMSGSEGSTVNAPDFLFGKYIDHYQSVKSKEPPTMSIVMKPLVFRYVVNFTIDHGMQYVALARGALAGMAESVYLYDGHTGSKTATILFDFDLTEDGGATVVNSFGVPDYPNRYYQTKAEDQHFALNIELRLTNGKILTYNFDISDQMRDQPRGGVIEVHGVTVSDKDGEERSGAFDVEVTDWGEYQDIVIELN